MLKYIDQMHGRHLPNVPARDLTDEEVEKFGKEFLLESGLYADADEPKIKTKVKKSHKAKTEAQ